MSNQQCPFHPHECDGEFGPLKEQFERIRSARLKRKLRVEIGHFLEEDGYFPQSEREGQLFGDYHICPEQRYDKTEAITMALRCSNCFSKYVVTSDTPFSVPFCPHCGKQLVSTELAEFMGTPTGHIIPDQYLSVKQQESDEADFVRYSHRDGRALGAYSLEVEAGDRTIGLHRIGESDFHVCRIPLAEGAAGDRTEVKVTIGWTDPEIVFSLRDCRLKAELLCENGCSGLRWLDAGQTDLALGRARTPPKLTTQLSDGEYILLEATLFGVRQRVLLAPSSILSIRPANCVVRETSFDGGVCRFSLGLPQLEADLRILTDNPVLSESTGFPDDWNVPEEFSETIQLESGVLQGEAGLASADNSLVLSLPPGEQPARIAFGLSLPFGPEFRHVVSAERLSAQTLLEWKNVLTGEWVSASTRPVLVVCEGDTAALELRAVFSHEDESDTGIGAVEWGKLTSQPDNSCAGDEEGRWRFGLPLDKEELDCGSAALEFAVHREHFDRAARFESSISFHVIRPEDVEAEWVEPGTRAGWGPVRFVASARADAPGAESGAEENAPPASLWFTVRAPQLPDRVLLQMGDFTWETEAEEEEVYTVPSDSIIPVAIAEVCRFRVRPQFHGYGDEQCELLLYTRSATVFRKNLEHMRATSLLVDQIAKILPLCVPRPQAQLDSLPARILIKPLDLQRRTTELHVTRTIPIANAGPSVVPSFEVKVELLEQKTDETEGLPPIPLLGRHFVPQGLPEGSVTAEPAEDEEPTHLTPGEALSFTTRLAFRERSNQPVSLLARLSFPGYTLPFPVSPALDRIAAVPSVPMVIDLGTSGLHVVAFLMDLLPRQAATSDQPFNVVAVCPEEELGSTGPPFWNGYWAVEIDDQNFTPRQNCCFQPDRPRKGKTTPLARWLAAGEIFSHAEVREPKPLLYRERAPLKVFTRLASGTEEQNMEMETLPIFRSILPDIFGQVAKYAVNPTQVSVIQPVYAFNKLRKGLRHRIPGLPLLSTNLNEAVAAGLASLWRSREQLLAEEPGDEKDTRLVVVDIGAGTADIAQFVVSGLRFGEGGEFARFRAKLEGAHAVPAAGQMLTAHLARLVSRKLYESFGLLREPGTAEVRWVAEELKRRYAGDPMTLGELRLGGRSPGEILASSGEGGEVDGGQEPQVSAEAIDKTTVDSDEFYNSIQVPLGAIVQGVLSSSSAGFDDDLEKGRKADRKVPDILVFSGRASLLHGLCERVTQLIRKELEKKGGKCPMEMVKPTDEHTAKSAVAIGGLLLAKGLEGGSMTWDVDSLWDYSLFCPVYLKNGLGNPQLAVPRGSAPFRLSQAPMPLSAVRYELRAHTRAHPGQDLVAMREDIHRFVVANDENLHYVTWLSDNGRIYGAPYEKHSKADVPEFIEFLRQLCNTVVSLPKRKTVWQFKGRTEGNIEFRSSPDNAWLEVLFQSQKIVLPLEEATMLPIVDLPACAVRRLLETEESALDICVQTTGDIWRIKAAVLMPGSNGAPTFYDVDIDKGEEGIEVLSPLPPEDNKVHMLSDYVLEYGNPTDFVQPWNAFLTTP